VAARKNPIDLNFCNRLQHVKQNPNRPLLLFNAQYDLKQLQDLSACQCVFFPPQAAVGLWMMIIINIIIIINFIIIIITIIIIIGGGGSGGGGSGGSGSGSGIIIIIIIIIILILIILHHITSHHHHHHRHRHRHQRHCHQHHHHQQHHIYIYNNIMVLSAAVFGRIYHLCLVALVGLSLSICLYSRVVVWA
jgi:amino acid transporter